MPLCGFWDRSNLFIYRPIYRLHEEVAEELGTCAFQIYFQLSITLALRWKREIQIGKYLNKFLSDIDIFYVTPYRSYQEDFDYFLSHL